MKNNDININEEAHYEVSNVTAIEDDNGNLIDFECFLEPVNMVAQIIDSGEESDFKESVNIVKVASITNEAQEQIEQIKERYGDKNLIRD